MLGEYYLQRERKSKESKVSSIDLYFLSEERSGNSCFGQPSRGRSLYVPFLFPVTDAFLPNVKENLLENITAWTVL